MKYFLLSLVCLIMLSCKSHESIKVYHINKINNAEHSIGSYYTLPQTYVNIDISVVETKYTPGPFAAYASKHLSIENVNRTPETIYTIGKIKINSFSEPDPEHMYFIDHVGKKGALKINYTEQGLIKSINIYDYDDYGDENKDETTVLGQFRKSRAFHFYFSEQLMEKVDTIYESILVDTNLVQRKKFVKSMVLKSTDAKAAEIADMIYNIREKKFALLSGFSEIPYDKEAIRFMYEEMNELENAYLELFTGITSKSVKKYRYTYLPNINKTQVDTLFMFSDQSGIMPANGEYGEAVTITSSAFQRIRKTPSYATDISSDHKNGFFYRIPEKGKVKIQYKDKTLSELDILISQFGNVYQLPSGCYELIFYPETGALKSVKEIER